MARRASLGAGNWRAPPASIKPRRSTRWPGDPLAVDLSAEGPWLPAEEIPRCQFSSRGREPRRVVRCQPTGPHEAGNSAADILSGTVTLQQCQLEGRLSCQPRGNLRGDTACWRRELRWEPVAFSYGPVKGTAGSDAYCALQSATNLRAATPVTIRIPECQYSSGSDSGRARAEYAAFRVDCAADPIELLLCSSVAATGRHFESRFVCAGAGYFKRGYGEPAHP